MAAVACGWFLLAAFDIWLLLIRPSAPWDAKIAFVLGLVGVYTFAFGVLSASGALDWRPELGRELTSPNPTRMLGAIFTVLALLSLGLSVALAADRTRESLERRGGTILFLVQTPLLLAGAFVVAGLAFFYVVLVAPLAWIAYAIASAPLDSIVGSGSDFEVAVSESGSAPLSIKRLVDEHLVVLRNALVAIPALVASLVLRAPGLL